MSGKFRDSNRLFWIFGIVVVLAVVGGPFIFFSEYEEGIAYLLSFLLIILSIVGYFPFTYGGFSADDEKVVFRLGFVKYTYYYSKIEYAETQVGFSRGRYGSVPYVKIDIKLKDEEDPETFQDNNVPDEALSTPELHKKFQDEHQFTALARFINEHTKQQENNY